MNKIELGIQKKLISFNEDKTEIFYLHHNNKKRNYTNPEEQVQAETYVSLILDYNYRPKQIGLYVLVTMGASKKEADIVVYHDDEQTQPHILIECKKQEVSEAEFNQAVEQAYSYAYAMPNDVKYVWVTSGIKNEYFEVDKTKGYHSPGVYFFKSGEILKKYCHQIVKENFSLNGEFYVSMIYDLMLRDQKNILVYDQISHFCQWGTPEDLEEFNFWISAIRRQG